MTLYCAIDLHSTNNVPVVIDDNDKILYQKRLPNDLGLVLSELAPFKSDLQGVAVESTFNWYWLVDGLLENDFHACLVNTCAVKQYDGIKHTNDHTDAFHLAHLMRLGILPTGYRRACRAGPSSQTPTARPIPDIPYTQRSEPALAYNGY